MNTLIKSPESVTLNRNLSNALVIDLRVGYPSGNKQIISIAQKLRQVFYGLTAPWGTAGIICGKDLALIRGKMDEVINEFHTEASNIIVAQDAILDIEYRNKFYAHYSIRPVELPNFNSTSLTPEQNENINNIIETSILTNIRALELNLINRVRDKVCHMAEAVSQGKNLHKSVVDNIDEVIEQCESLNVNKNRMLSDLFDEIRANIHGADIILARTDKEERGKFADIVGKSIDTIHAAMEEYVG